MLVARVPLPATLPPTFHGTSVRFSYHFELSCVATVTSGDQPSQLARPVERTESDESRTSVSELDNSEVTESSAGPQRPLLARQAFRVLSAAPAKGGAGAEGPDAPGGPSAAAAVSPRAAAARAAAAAADDATRGPFIPYCIIPEAQCPSIKIEVVGTRERSGAGRARHSAGGHPFLWAPNEVDAPSLPGMAGAGGSLASLPDSASTPELVARGARGASGGTSAGAGLARVDSSASSAPGRDVPSLPRGPGAVSASPLQMGRRSSASEAGTPRAHLTPRDNPPHAADLRTFGLALRGLPFARVELHAAPDGALWPGATVSVTIDFRPDAVRLAEASLAGRADGPTGGGAGALRALVCHQVVVLLETEETVAREWLLNSARRASTGMVAGGASAGGAAIRKLYQEIQDVTHDVLFTSFTLTVPSSGTPCFQTPIVSLRWGLRFEFLVTKAGAAMWTPPEEIIWRLPLAVSAPPIPAVQQ